MAKDNKKLVEAITSMDVDFAQWYTDVVKKAELIDYSAVKGCMIIRPAGYAIWENIQKELDRRFKETGVENVYMPLFIPESLLEKEKDHVSVSDLHLRRCSAIFIKILFTLTVTFRRYTISGARWYAGRRRRDRSSVPGNSCGRRDTPRMRPQRKPSSARFRC